mgnify:CR=1 FL=1
MLFLVSVSPLLPVFGFLTCRAAAVRTGYVFLFLGFGLHLAVFFLNTSPPPLIISSISLLIPKSVFWSMMEQSHTCKSHRDVVLVTGLYNVVVAY